MMVRNNSPATLYGKEVKKMDGSLMLKSWTRSSPFEQEIFRNVVEVIKKMELYIFVAQPALNLLYSVMMSGEALL